jgi:uncharacterized protein
MSHPKIFVANQSNQDRTQVNDSNPPFRLWVDADAAPRDVKEVVFRAAARLQIETILVAACWMTIPNFAATVRLVQVNAGNDAADRFIVQNSNAGDIAITADIPLAALLVAKKVLAIDPRGDVYDERNIKSRLAARDFFESVRAAGIQTGGAAPYDSKDKKAFANSLDRALAKMIKERET